MEKKVILFADNDPDFLATRSEFLEQAGYVVIRASNPAQAQRELESGELDLAILDIRLVDDDDEKDSSGLALAKEVARSVPKVILTGFPTIVAAREALRPRLDGLPAAVGFLDKDEGVGEMLRAVRAALTASLPTSKDRWRTLRQLSGPLSLAALFLALTTGILAIVTGDPRWLLATVFLTALMVVGIAILVYAPAK